MNQKTKGPRIVRTPSGFIIRRARPVCRNCGMVNTVTASGHCVNCHAHNGG